VALLPEATPLKEPQVASSAATALQRAFPDRFELAIGFLLGLSYQDLTFSGFS